LLVATELYNERCSIETADYWAFIPLRRFGKPTLHQTLQQRSTKASCSSDPYMRPLVQYRRHSGLLIACMEELRRRKVNDLCHMTQISPNQIS